MATDEKQPPDLFLEATVERSLAPYRDLVSPETLEVMREMLVEALTEDEVSRDLLERARPKASPLQSGSSPVNGVAAAPLGPDSKPGGRRG